MAPAKLRGGALRGLLGLLLVAAVIELVPPAVPRFALTFTHTWYGVPATASSSVVPPGSLVHTRLTDSAALQAGDVVVYRRPEEPGHVLVHRVESVEPASGPIATGVRVTFRGADPSAPPVILQMVGPAARVTLAVPRVAAIATALWRARLNLYVGAAALLLNAVWLRTGLSAMRWRVRTAANSGSVAALPGYVSRRASTLV